MIERNNEHLTVTRQCELLGIPRSSLYYESSGTSEEDKRTMNLIDEIYTVCPFYGNRRIRAELNMTNGIDIGRDKVRTLMGVMGIQALYPKKNLGLRNKQNPIYPYLLRHLNIEKPNQVRSTDIAYIRFKEGLAYLIAVIDWYSRYVVNWKLSNTLGMGFCLECLKEALEKRKPEIFNTDQGSHFTSPKFTGILEANKVSISMDGRGRYLDNIFVERLWRTVKQENIYLNDYGSVLETRFGLQEYFPFYNTKRRHQSLDYRTPEEIYYS